MSVKWDFVDALDGLAEDLMVEGRFVKRIHEAVVMLRKERDELKAEVEQLRAEKAMSCWPAPAALEAVAERQRAACAEAVLKWSKSQAQIASDKERDSIMASAEMHREEAIMARRISAAIRASPLVTEDK